jgi:hypothetical protein
MIYKLVNYDYPELVYVGSNTYLTKGNKYHTDTCLNEKNKKHNYKVYVNIRENCGWKTGIW